jgi:hypothetical protein
MSIYQPAFLLQRVGADWTVSATVAGDVSGFALKATFRDQVGASGTTWATKTSGSGIVSTFAAGETTIVVTLEDTDTDNLTPGPYVWRLERTDAGGEYDLIDWSTVFLTPDVGSAAPQLVNMSELIAMSQGALTETVSDTDAKFYLPLISAAEATVRRFCGRNFSYGSYTEYMDSPTVGNLWARELPIHSITTLKYDARGGFGQLTDSFDSTTLLTAGSDYFFRKDQPDGLGYGGEIFTTRPGGWSWWGRQGRMVQPAGHLSLQAIPVPGAFQLVYLAGYKLVPGDLKFAVLQMVQQMSQRTERGVPLQSESGMNYSYSLGAAADEAARLDSVQAILRGYRRGSTYMA